MKNEEFEIIRGVLLSEAKICAGSKFPMGATPLNVGAKDENLNEIDIAYTKKGIRVKCFYDKLTNSPNSSPFYLDIDPEEVDIWTEACKVFSSQRVSTSILAKMEARKNPKGF